MDQGSIKWWGYDRYDELGSESKNTQNYSATPVSVSRVSEATVVSAGSDIPMLSSPKKPLNLGIRQ